MIVEVNENLRKKMKKDGSVLRYMQSGAGLGLGLLAGGLVLAAAGLLLTVLMIGALEPSRAVIVGMIFMAPGVLLLLLGFFLHKRRLDNYLKAYRENSGLTDEEILQAEAEFDQPGTVLLSLEKGKSMRLKQAGFLTEHYVKFPGIYPNLFKVDELIACFFTKKFVTPDGGYNDALIAYSYRTVPEGCRVLTDAEKACQEIVELIASRNPRVIVGHHFSVEGKKYDAVRQIPEVAELHKNMYQR